MHSNTTSLKKFYSTTCEVLWALALIALPLTSFPLLSDITGALVAPLALVPFIILLVILVIPHIFHKNALPKETIPLVVFSLLAILACAAAFFIFIPGFKGRTVTGQEVRALVTLVVGISFYLVTVTWMSNPDKLKNTWKYITIGGMISLVWTGLQAFFILRHVEQYPAWMDHIQAFLVVASPAFSAKYGRVNGLTYEASWFAHQMVILYLPLWIAASYYKTSAFAFKLWRISLENILLVIGLALFFLSSPRIGLLSLLLIVIFLFFRLNLLLQRRIVNWVSRWQNNSHHASPIFRKKVINILTSISIIVLYILILAGIFFFAVQRDWRLSMLVSEPPTTREIVGLLTLDQNTLLDLSHRFIFLERMVYWMNGWNVFNQYPWLGVGLGNAGFFFPTQAPSIGWATYEIRNVLYYLNQLPNVKSLWFRLLAETGIFGFSSFIVWLVVLYRSSRFSQHHLNPVIKTFAFAGQLALLAFIGEGFSIDSFAMPYFWIVAGLIASTAMLYRSKFQRP